MSVPEPARDDTAELAQTELHRDQQVENRLFWKGLAALLFTVAVAVARQRWWI
jgi:hypothetical protein